MVRVCGKEKPLTSWLGSKKKKKKKKGGKGKELGFHNILLACSSVT
jgi:hypothetical protein